MTKPHVPMLKENNVRQGFFEWEQFLTVRSHLPGDLQQVATFSYITGWRRSEVLNLQWQQVDFKAGFVHLEPGTTKNDEARMFPLTGELRAVLEAQKVKADALKKLGIICPWVFHRSGRKSKGTKIQYFRPSWKIACKAAGLPGRLVHDFRGTAVRNLIRAGIPERVAMKLTGHKTRSVFERYNIVSEGDFNDAARRLDIAQQAQFQAQSAQIMGRGSCK